MVLAAATEADLVVRTFANEEVATTFVTLAEIEAALRLRLDTAAWEAATVSTQVKAMIGAYNELVRLPWSSGGFGGSNQSRDIGSALFAGVRPEPPLTDSLFRSVIAQAQAAQALFLLGGTHVRSLQREGVRFTRQLQGAEMEITAYKGPVCAEAKELLGPFLDTQIRRRAFA